MNKLQHTIYQVLKKLAGELRKSNIAKINQDLIRCAG